MPSKFVELEEVAEHSRPAARPGYHEFNAPGYKLVTATQIGTFGLEPVYEAQVVGMDGRVEEFIPQIVGDQTLQLKARLNGWRPM